MRAPFLCLVVVAAVLPPWSVRGAQHAEFPFKDGDRIVLVGDTFIERDQRYGYLEALLTLQNPDKTLVFRNLGWSGDTVEGVSRSGFDPPAAGFEQLTQQILATRPTVVLLGYGMADSFAGEAGLPRFEKELNRLLNVIDSTHARIILLSPIAHEDLDRPLPDPGPHNTELELYTHAMSEVARRRNLLFINLFASFPPRRQGHHLTDNGIHLKEHGYRLAAFEIDRPLVSETLLQAPSVELASDGKIGSSHGAHVDGVETSAGGIRCRIVRNLLPMGDAETTGLTLKVTGLPAGSFGLKVDGGDVATRSSTDWAIGVRITTGPDLTQFERLRTTVNRKNELFFYRWRPQNHTYLFGFRQHEQGNNAVEIPQFDPLVAEREREIGRLKKPIPHVYELTRAEREVTR